MKIFLAPIELLVDTGFAGANQRNSERFDLAENFVDTFKANSLAGDFYSNGVHAMPLVVSARTFVTNGSRFKLADLIS